MGKKENMIGNMISDEVVSKIIDAIENKTDDFIESVERNNIRKMELEEKKFEAEQNLKEKKFQAKVCFCKDEQKSVRDEFNRVLAMLKSTDPKTENYEKLTDALYNLKKLLTGWSGSDFDWD